MYIWTVLYQFYIIKSQKNEFDIKDVPWYAWYMINIMKIWKYEKYQLWKYMFLYLQIHLITKIMIDTHNLYGIYGIFFINEKCFFLISKDFSISSILDIILSEDIIFYGIITLKKYKYIIIISILI